MRRIVPTAMAIGLIPGALFAQGAPKPIANAPAPQALIAQNLGDQVDDSDLAREENLQDLMREEYDDASLSVGAAVTLSLIPGAGYGLAYAGKKAQSLVPFTLSAIGYGVGAAYFFGAFNTSTSTFCRHVRDGRVQDFDECAIADNKGTNTDPGNKAIDPRSPDMLPYFKTAEDYSVVTSGEDFDGKRTGLLIMGGTYVFTTLVGAIWASSVVSDHNDRLQKDIESTAQNEGVQPRPVVAYDGNEGFFGLALDW